MPDELPQGQSPEFTGNNAPNPEASSLFAGGPLPEPDENALKAATSMPSADFISEGAEGKFQPPEPTRISLDQQVAAGDTPAELPSAPSAEKIETAVSDALDTLPTGIPGSPPVEANSSSPPIRPNSPPTAGPAEARMAGQHNADGTDASGGPGVTETGAPTPAPETPKDSIDYDAIVAAGGSGEAGPPPTSSESASSVSEDILNNAEEIVQARGNEAITDESTTPSVDLDAMTPEERNQYATSTDPEKQKLYKEWKAKGVREAERKAFDQARPIDAKPGESFEDYKKREEAIKKFNRGEELEQKDIDLIAEDVARNEEIQDKLDRGEELNAYEHRLAVKYGLEAKAKVSEAAQRENRIRELDAAIKRGAASPEDRREYMRLRAERDSQEKDSADRDLLRDKLLTDGKLSDEEMARLDELDAKLKDRELTPAEKRKEVDRLATKMAQDMMEGRELNAADLERFRKLKTEIALDETGVPAGRKAIIEQIQENFKNGEGKRLKEKQDTAVEKQTKEKLAELMNLEMQMLAIPRQIEALAKAQKKLKRDIATKKSQIGSSNNQETQAKRRTELYPLMMALARNKGLLGYYKNAGLVLRAEYKVVMADLNRTLRLNGRFGIIPDVLQHLDAMVTKAYADIKTDYDSIYNSEADEVTQKQAA